MERKNMWEGYSEAELKELEAVNARYRECLDVAKTEETKCMQNVWGKQLSYSRSVKNRWKRE